MTSEVLQKSLKALDLKFQLSHDEFHKKFIETAKKLGIETTNWYSNGEAFMKYVNGTRKGSRKSNEEINEGIHIVRHLEEEYLNAQLFASEISSNEYEQKKLQYNFFSKFREEIKKRFISTKHKEIIPFLANRCKVHPEDVSKLAAAFPTIAFAIVDSKSYKDDYISNLLFVSDNTKYNASTRVASHYNVNKKISEFKGLLLGHSISPYSEQLNLLLEIGRYKRIEQIFNLEAKIIITKPAWGELNFGSQYLDKLNFDIRKNLECGYKYRIKLYDKVGFKDITKLERDSVVSKYLTRTQKEKENDIDYKKYLDQLKVEFTKQLHWYVEFAQIIQEYYEIGVINKETYKDLIKKINALIGDDSFEIRSKLDGKLSLLKHTNSIHDKQMYVISCILESFFTIDKETFEYVFLQRFAQHEFSGYLKIGVESEYMFDKPYTELDRLDEIHNHEISAFYIKHYTYGKEDKMHTIPYYFPSGSIIDKANITNEELQRAQNEVIFVFDHKTKEGKTKIKDIVSSMTISSIAHQMSDLFSFIRYFFKDNINFWEVYSDVLKDFEPELATAWELYKEDEETELHNFTENFLSIGFDIGYMPYYYYPYLIALMIKTENPVGLEIKFRNFFINTIILVLSNVDDVMSLDDWKHKK